MTTKKKILSTESDSSRRYAAKYSVAALLPGVAATTSPTASPSPTHAMTQAMFRDERARTGSDICRRRLLLFPKHLRVGLAVGIKAPAFAIFPSGFQFGRRDVPIRTAFPECDTQVLSKLFQRRPAKKPVAVVDLEHHETGLENDDMRNHRVVLGVRVLGDVEILLNLASRIG